MALTQPEVAGFYSGVDIISMGDFSGDVLGVKIMKMTSVDVVVCCYWNKPKN